MTLIYFIYLEQDLSGDSAAFKHFKHNVFKREIQQELSRDLAAFQHSNI